jgi:hypothetical protein
VTVLGNLDPGTAETQIDRLETPFVGVSEAPWSSESASAEWTTIVPETPFVGEYLLGDEAISQEQPAFRELLQELYDTEFDEAILELAGEAESYVAELGLGETAADQAKAETLLESWVEPLRREAEAMLVGLAEALEAEDPIGLSEDELEALIDRFEPAETGLAPAFEDFLGKLLRKAKKLTKGAVNLAKKGISAVSKVLPIGIILRKLAVLARPLLARVTKFALNKLPVQYREPAQILARKLFGRAAGESFEGFEDEAFESPGSAWAEDALEADEQPATPDVREIQLAFDAEATSLLFAASELEQDLFLAEAGTAAAQSSASSLEELDTARERFSSELARLPDGADPTPLVENFLPAILPALRLGLKIAGRPRVVRFLAQYLGRLISPYVGPKITPALSQAIVDAGLRLMTLEAEADGEATPQLAAESFASLVEDTVARVAQLEEEDLEDEQLLEEAAYVAFHESAAANFPTPVLSPESEYLESGRSVGTWVSMPRRGPKRYRKYSRVFDVVIHPSAARSIRTFGGRPLSAFLRDGLGRSGPLRARIHLYQAIPGSSPARIARSERGVAGLGTARQSARSRLHPLSREAAATLIGEPGLGRDVSEAYTEAPSPLAIGQRLYYLEVPGATTTPVAAGAPPGTPRRSSDATAIVDMRAREVKVTLYVSEADAQSIAARLRRREPLGASLASLRRIYARALGPALGAGRASRVRIASEGEETLEGEHLVRRRRPATGRRRHPRRLRRPLLVRWIGRALAHELERCRESFLRATEAPEDGVTIVLRLRPPDLSSLTHPGPRGGSAGAGPGQVHVDIAPGHPRA